MKRGRIFIYLALIIIIAVAAGGVYLWLNRTPPATQVSATATPQYNLLKLLRLARILLPVLSSLKQC